MPNFSERSLNNLEDAHRDLCRIAHSVIDEFDFIALESFRGEKRQNRLYEINQSQLKFPDSKHNQVPSKALDVAPYPVDWKDRERFVYLAGMFFGVWKELKEQEIVTHRLRWGGDWDMDEHLTDNKFDDLGHFELV